MCSNAPNSQSLNFSHMFHFNDIRGNLPIKTYKKGSIMYLLDTHPDFTKFCYIVKLAELDNILDDAQADFTLFVPADSELKYRNNIDIRTLNMDVGTARQIVLSSLLDARIPSELLKDSPAAYFITKDPANRMFITNVNENSKINNYMNIIHFDVTCTNGLVHIVDNLINPLQL